MALAFAHGAYRFACADLQLFDHALYLLRRFLGAMGQVAHFIGDHRETTPGLASAGRLDGRVERQQVGLLGNAGDDFQDLPDVHGLAVECFDMAAGGADQVRQAIHCLDAAVDHLLAFFGKVAGGAGML
ncbi:hypothetical protein D9M71_161810 [compost metagenome]